MKIRRITAQKTSLDEFYRELAERGRDSGYFEMAARMLELLRHLREVEGPELWAVTSLFSLNLIAGDDYELPTLVSINTDGQWFNIEYRMPSDKAPWPNAYVRGRAPEVLRAGEMILFGLCEALA